MNRLKQVLLPIYAFLRYNYFRYIKRRQFKSFDVNPDCELSKVSNYDESFFGYYTLSPENEEGVLTYCANKKQDKVSVVINKDGLESVITNTSAFNLQQGCMEQWGYKTSNRLYYNVYNKEKEDYECEVVDVTTNSKINTLSKPIYALSKQEDYALSLNFDRLTVMRPDYGYFCKMDYKLPSNDNDGIWKIDVNTGASVLIITLQQLIQLNPVSSMKGAMHKVNHIDISPDGKRFMFLHRWVGPQGRYMRLITADSQGENLYILNGDRMTSHSYWINNQQIVSFCYTEQFKNSYVIFKDMTKEISLVSSKLPHYDGHPSSYLGKWLVTDSYPDDSRMSKLILLNMETDQIYILGRFYQPLKYRGPSRIDLHPKWNLTGNSVYFESGHDGKRKLYKLNVSKLIKNEA